MLALLTALHVLVAVVLILIVLLQSARGADLAGAFGGMGSQTAFGPRGTATFLSKATVVLAAVFMASSIGLSILANRSVGVGGESILSGEKSAPTQSTKPAGAPSSAPAGTPQVQVETPGADGNPLGVKVEVQQPNEPGKPAATKPPEPAAQTPPQQPAEPAQPSTTP